MINSTVLWVILMSLYAGTAVILEIVYRREIKHRVSAIFLTIGCAIFVAIHARLFVEPWLQPDTAELAIIAFLFFAWIAGVSMVIEKHIFDNDTSIWWR